MPLLLALSRCLQNFWISDAVDGIHVPTSESLAPGGVSPKDEPPDEIRLDILLLSLTLLETMLESSQHARAMYQALSAHSIKTTTTMVITLTGLCQQVWETAVGQIVFSRVNVWKKKVPSYMCVKDW